MNRDDRSSAALVDATSPPGVRASDPGGVVRAIQVGEASDGAPLEPVLRDLGWTVETAPDVPQALVALRRESVDVVVIDARSNRAASDELGRFVELAVTRQIAAIVVGDEPAIGTAGGSTLVTRIPTNTSLGELRGRLAMVERYHTLIQGMERELTSMQQLTDRLNDHFREIDDEMQLASRLQHDFLPDLNEPIRGVQFASIYRPATWVSGDMFDVFRIDEDHTGVYLADAVGHGMAAGLLTMFIKRVIMPKRIHARGYEVVSPSMVLTMLNDALAEQELPNCQFVTACYGVIDHRAYTFTFARGGHPYPLQLATDGSVRELTAPGGLLGLFGGAEFSERTVDLDPGDKVVLFTDGIEHVLPHSVAENASIADRLRKFLGAQIGAPLGEAFAAIESDLSGRSDAHAPKDDLTILAFEMSGEEPGSRG